MKKTGLIILMSLILLTAMTMSVFANQVTGNVTTWHKTSQMAPPKEVPASGVTVVIGKNINIDINPSGSDTIYGEVIARTTTDNKGNFTANVPSGQNYQMILWKQGYTPVSYTINSPGQTNGQIAKSDRLIHNKLNFKENK